MIIAVLLAAALAWWLHRDGVLLPNLRRLGVAAGAALLAVRLMETGLVLAALAVGAGGIWWWVVSRPATIPTTAVTAARGLLGVGTDADAAAINAAWRQRMAQVHPDRGGDTMLTAQVTAARDLLLRR